MQYYLGGTGSGDVSREARLQTADVKAASANGTMAAVFTTVLPPGTNLSPLPLIFASGYVYSNGYLRCAALC